MSDTQTILQIDTQAEIEKIIRQLDTLPNKLKAPSVLASAINATANEMKKKIGQRARKRYAISDRGGMVESMAYMTRKNTETTAAMLKVLNESAMTALEVDGRKAFQTTFQSGHTAIVQRVGRSRLPVRSLMAPAVPMLYGKSYEEAELDYYAILQRHIQREVERALCSFGNAA